VAEDLCGSEVRLEKSGEYPYRRGLAGTIRPQQAVHNAFANCQVNAVNGTSLAKILDQA
jgi:hypothetical protein